MAYPTSVQTFTTRNTGDSIEASHVNTLQTEVNAIEDGLLNGFAHNIKFTSAEASISQATSDGSDNQLIIINGGGGAGSSRGAELRLTGNEAGGILQVKGGAAGGDGSTGSIQFITNDILRSEIELGGSHVIQGNINVGMGSSLFGSGAGVLAIANGAQGTAVANQIMLTSEDVSAGNTILSLRTEGAGVLPSGTPAASTGAVAIKINGTVFYVPCAATAPTP